MGETNIQVEALANYIRANPEAKYVAFLDTDHTSAAIREVIGHPDIITALQETGKNVYIQEGGKANAAFAESIKDAIAASPDGSFGYEYGLAAYHAENPKKNEDYSLKAAEAVVNPLAHGIDVVYPDADPLMGEISAQNSELAENFSLVAGTISEAKCLEVDVAALEASGALSPEAMNALGDSLRSRSDQNMDAATIENAVALSGHQPAAMAYGAEHFLKAGDMDELLAAEGNGEVLSIALFPNAESRLTVGEPTANDLPSAMFNIAEGILTPLSPNTPAADNFWARFPNSVTNTIPVLSSEEFKQCVADLPASLRAYAGNFSDQSTGKLGGLAVQAITQPPVPEREESRGR